jgi:hypothetical protein
MYSTYTWSWAKFGVCGLRTSRRNVNSQGVVFPCDVRNLRLETIMDSTYWLQTGALIINPGPPSYISYINCSQGNQKSPEAGYEKAS